ncbi:MAG: peptidase M16 [endosymbiont of Galathealinum brachiosum]|uniref:Peptidase M16 n=1 Tax=endosymbiont of Galathealinum brachiosum TaxID=2200906 RepID=A0A370DDF9_9GAMM|nr:MAG: peptidase M16 [endosymbiont of Galathealinum brachiosum]
MVINKSLVTLGLLFVQGLVFASPDIQHWQTENGADVYFVPSNDIPMVDVRIVFDAGSARDSEVGNNLAGTAIMTNGLLSEGAAGDDAQVLAEKFEAVGASFSNGSLKDMAWLSVRSLRDDRYLQPALINLKNILSLPDFSKASFKREIERLKISVKAGKQSPATIASLRFYAELYGDHPYAQPSEGTDESLKKIKLNHLKAFYKKYYVAKNAVIGIVGQLTTEEAKKIAADLVADLPAGEHAKKLPEVKALTEAKTIHIDFPSRQSSVMMGQVGMARGDVDYYALYLANHAFGGSGFGSRLMQEVREERGLAYSVYSYYSPMHAQGPFMIGLKTRNDQLEQAMGIINLELKKYVNEGPEQDELQDSLKNITGGFPLRIDSNKKIVEYLSVIGFYDLPLDYLDTFVGSVNQQDKIKVDDALKRRVHPDKMLTVIVGAKSDQE